MKYAMGYSNLRCVMYLNSLWKFQTCALCFGEGTWDVG